jgi:hypothetical protein
LEVSYKNETLPKKEINNVIKELDETKYKNTSTDLYDIGPICETEDLTVDITNVKSLMNVLGSEIDYNAWYCSMCIFKNEKYNFNDFIEWSNLFTRHTNIEEECEKMWNRTKVKTDKCFTINTLIKLVQRKYPNATVFEKYKIILIQQVYEPTIDFEELRYQKKKNCDSLCEDF